MKKFYIQALNYDRSVCLNDHYAKVVRYRPFVMEKRTCAKFCRCNGYLIPTGVVKFKLVVIKVGMEVHIFGILRLENVWPDFRR